jgi:glycosyltransferase involved in cell wall biosynthesis
MRSAVAGVAPSRDSEIGRESVSVEPSIAVVILTRNEEAAIATCIESARDVSSEIVVVDSLSTDSTVSIATSQGARVVPFIWDGQYPKKKEWSLRNSGLNADWVLMLDADERVSKDLAIELRAAAGDASLTALDIPLRYYWRGTELHHGQTVYKRAFLRPDKTHFPVVADLRATGITEVEGHYQPIVDGRIARARSYIHHDDPDPLSDWFGRHNRYSDWEAFLRVNPAARSSVRPYRSGQGRAFERLPLKPLVIFLYNYVLKSGWRDGRVGFEYAASLAFYQLQIEMKVRELQARNSHCDAAL